MLARPARIERDRVSDTEREKERERERERERGREREIDRERECVWHIPYWADVSLRQDGADGGEAPETGNNVRQHLVHCV